MLAKIDTAHTSRYGIIRFSKESKHRGAADGRAYAFFAKSDGLAPGNGAV